MMAYADIAENDRRQTVRVELGRPTTDEVSVEEATIRMFDMELHRTAK